MDNLSFYNDNFYEIQAGQSVLSADVIVPIIYDIVKPDRVVDFGCGVGAWLNRFRICGANEVLGLEGGQVPRAMLQIEEEYFQKADFRHPVDVGQFDLACSLEVAEHLPSDVSAQFVQSLCRAAPVVLFSAAVPFQGGTNHINERWLSEWCVLFAKHDYIPVDVVRPRIWYERDIPFWYKQNLLLFVCRDSLSRLGLSEQRVLCDVIHPDIWRKRMQLLQSKQLKIAPPESIRGSLSHIHLALSVIRRRLRSRILGERKN